MITSILVEHDRCQPLDASLVGLSAIFCTRCVRRGVATKRYVYYMPSVLMKCMIDASPMVTIPNPIWSKNEFASGPRISPSVQLTLSHHARRRRTGEWPKLASSPIRIHLRVQFVHRHLGIDMLVHICHGETFDLFGSPFWALRHSTRAY